MTMPHDRACRELSSAMSPEALRELSRFNKLRLTPGLGEPLGMEPAAVAHALRLEADLVETVRGEIAPLVVNVPVAADAFVAWYENLRETGPGQGDPLFPWLATSANREQMRWFLHQEVAGEAGFDDLLAMTQVKMPEPAKLEMARNFWDEMGRGKAKGMHGRMLDRLARHFDVAPVAETTVPQSLTLGNVMIGLATNRRYAFHSVGALGVIELTAPGRAAFVTQGLRRLGVPAKESHYFALHAVLDVKHSEAWNREVLRTLVAEDPRRAQPIAEGAVMRLWCGARCFDRYRSEFGLGGAESVRAA
jgi:hypothetical protein